MRKCRFFSASMFFYIVVAVCICSCTPPEQKLTDDAKSLVEKAKSLESNTDELAWDAIDKDAETLTKRYDELSGSMSDEQRKSYNEAVGKLQGLKIKAGLHQFQKQLEDFGSQVEGAIKEMGDSSREEIENTVQ